MKSRQLNMSVCGRKPNPNLQVIVSSFMRYIRGIVQPSTVCHRDFVVTIGMLLTP